MLSNLGLSYALSKKLDLAEQTLRRGVPRDRKSIPGSGQNSRLGGRVCAAGLLKQSRSSNRILPPEEASPPMLLISSRCWPSLTAFEPPRCRVRRRSARRVYETVSRTAGVSS